MNILLIGHRGYLGRGLNAYLGRRHRVLGWDKEEDLFNLDAALLAREKIEVLINLSVAADRKSSAFQVDGPTDKVNVEGARHLARILKGSDIAWFQMSTREVFGPVYRREDVLKTPKGYRPKFLVDENVPFAPRNCYGKSKLIAELISETHPRSNVLRLTTGYTDYDCAVPGWMLVLIKAALEGKPVSLSGGGLQFRDPVHMDDLGSLIERLAEKGIYGQKLNVGGGRKNLLSLHEFVRRAVPGADIRKGPHGDYGFAFDNRTATKLTGWKPAVLLRDKIPVIVDNVRRKIEGPVDAGPAKVDNVRP